MRRVVATGGQLGQRVLGPAVLAELLDRAAPGDALAIVAAMARPFLEQEAGSQYVVFLGKMLAALDAGI